MLHSGSWAEKKEQELLRFCRYALSVSGKNSQDAEMHLRNAERINPEHNEVLLTKAVILKIAGKYDEAVTILRKRMLKVADPEGFQLLGAIYRIQGKYADAEAALRQSLQLGPTYAAYKQLHLLYYKTKQWPKQAQVIADWQALDPEATEPLLCLAEAQRKQRRQHAAIATIGLVPVAQRNLKMWLCLAYCYIELEQWVAAKTAFESIGSSFYKGAVKAHDARPRLWVGYLYLYHRAPSLRMQLLSATQTAASQLLRLSRTQLGDMQWLDFDRAMELIGEYPELLSRS